MTKPKKCKVNGCDLDVVAFPNSTINRPYCSDHAIEYAIQTIRKGKLKQAKKEKIEANKETAQKKVDLMSIDGYRSKYVQPLINEIARCIDYGQNCIATNLPGKMSGGHYFSIGHNRTICLNLHNIHVQSFHSNSSNSGDNLRYRDGLIKIYGWSYLGRVEALKQLKPLHLTKDDLKEIKINATAILKELKADLKVRTPDERIELRNVINERLGIY